MPRPSLRLVVFDLDGTLADSTATIVACVRAAFLREGLTVPSDLAIRRIIGLSLAVAMGVLAESDDPALAERLAQNYRDAFEVYRARPDFAEPLFPGARDALDDLQASGLLLGVATGKALRGLRSVLAHHGLTERFTTLQTADQHPSKPHPAMLQAALAECGVTAAEAVMVGDAVFDMQMAQAAGMTGIGVAWGNYPGAELRTAGAAAIVEHFADLSPLLAALFPSPSGDA